MRSKQTIFKHQGYWMRSHSETRWASIMTALRIRWIYEPQVIDTRHGWYMPDFYLPGAGVFVEVKGPYPTLIEQEKAIDAEAQTNCPVIIVHGDMEQDGPDVIHGVLSNFDRKGEVSYSTYEVSQLVRHYLNRWHYQEFHRAGERTVRPDYRVLGDLMQEYLFQLMDRDQLEASLRDHHTKLNAPILEQHGPLSMAEWALSQFFRLKQERRQIQEAA